MRCLAEDITFDHAPNPQHPAIHSDALIECQVSGLPIPDVSWKYNGLPIALGLLIIQSNVLHVGGLTC